MEAETLVIIQERYNEIKEQVGESVIVYEPGFEIKHAYHIGHRIDMGKKAIYSQVRVCTHRESSLRRAVKTYYLGDCQEFNSDIIFTKRPGLKLSMILNEIYIASRLNHPNICRIYEAFLEAKFIHLVMDYCRGGEIYDYLTNHSSFSVTEAFPIFYQLLDAVNYMDSQNIAHRALGIENIMFYDKQYTKIKIISFSSACEGDSFSEKYGCGLYMAPEVFAGNYNRKCDIWSLGVCFYAMLVGYQPFQGKTVNEIIKKVNAGKLPKHPIYKKMNKDMKKIIKKMVQKETQRLSAEEILDSKSVQKLSKDMYEFIFMKTLKALKPPKPSEEFIIKVQFANKVKAMLTQLLVNLTIFPDLEHFKTIWDVLDDEELGVIQMSVLETFIGKKCADSPLIKDKFFDIFKRFDTFKNETVCFDDFLTTIAILNDKALILEGFNKLDEDKDGIIGPGDFFREFDKMNFEEFELIFSEALGKITMNREDFCNLVIKFSS